MDPIIGGALIGVGANLLGNLFGKSNTDKTNETNLKIAQMNNDFNERMMEKQMAYNTEMWDKQNAYNTASAQRERLEEAGLNPYMMMNGGSAGTASNAGSVSAAQASGNPTMQAFHPDFSGITQSLQSALALKEQQRINTAAINKQVAETESINIENQYKASTIVADLAERWARTNNWQLKNAYQNLMNTTFMDTWNADMQNKLAQFGLAQEQIEAQQLENAAKAIQNFYLPQQLKANLAETLSRINLNNKKAETEVQQAVKVAYEAAGIKLNNENLEKMSDDIIRQMEIKTGHDEIVAANDYWNYKVNEANSRGSLGKGGRFVHSVGTVGNALFPFFTAGGLFKIGQGISGNSTGITKSDAKKILGK